MSVPYLCMGTFFFLLIQARKPKATANTYINGHIDPMSDACLMNGLVYAFTGKLREIKNDTIYTRIKRHTSPLRECKEDGSKDWTPFNHQPVISGYRQDVQNNYSDTVERMSEFVDEYLDEDKYDWLVDALVGTIERDRLIPDEEEFYIMPGGSKKTKAQMKDIELFELQPFLVGVLFYIVDKRSDSNSEGKDTLEAWGDKPEANKERKLKSNVRLGTDRGIKAHYYIAEEDAVDELEVEKVEETDPIVEAVEPYKEEDNAEYSNDQHRQEDREERGQEIPREPFPFGTYIQNQYVSPVIMTGSHAKSYTINGDVTINNWEDDEDG